MSLPVCTGVHVESSPVALMRASPTHALLPPPFHRAISASLRNIANGSTAEWRACRVEYISQGIILVGNWDVHPLGS